jgi:hypothetical protein
VGQSAVSLQHTPAPPAAAGNTPAMAKPDTPAADNAGPIAGPAAAGTGATAEAAVAEAVPGARPASSSAASEHDCVTVACGPITGFYSCRKSKVLVLQQQQGPAPAVGSWLGPTAFMRLAGPAHIKHSPDSAIDVMKPDGSKAMSLKTFLKHWHKNRAGGQQLQGLWVMPPDYAAAGSCTAGNGGTAAGGGMDSASGTVQPGAGAAAKAAANTKATGVASKAPRAAAASTDQVQPSSRQQQQHRAGSGKQAKVPAAAAAAAADAKAGVEDAATGPIDPSDVVEVLCGAERGWYSSSRDLVLPQSAAPAASKLRKAKSHACPTCALASAWLSTAEFKASAKVQDAKMGNAAAIHVVGSDGAQGVTLQAHLKGLKARKQPPSLQKEGPKPRAGTSAAAKAAAAAEAAKPPRHPRGASATAKTAGAAAGTGGKEVGRKGAQVHSAVSAPLLDTLAAAAAAAMTPSVGRRSSSSSGGDIAGRTRGSTVEAAAAPPDFCVSPRTATLMLADEQIRDAAEGLVELHECSEASDEPEPAHTATAAAGPKVTCSNRSSSSEAHVRGAGAAAAAGLRGGGGGKQGQQGAAGARDGKKRAAAGDVGGGSKRHKS